MKRLITLVAILFAFPLAAQQQQPPEKVDPAAMMEMYKELGKPADGHARLTGLTGRWTVTNRLWFDPAGEAVAGSGPGTGRMILGGRFLQLDANVGGAYPMESLTVLGFDRRFNEYTLAGFDSTGTYFITAAGKWDETAKQVVLEGSYAMPPTNEQQKYRFVWTSASRDEHLFRLDFLNAGKWVRVAETQLSRAK
jgi:Protein of unknown function (DUF1579)